MTESPQDPDFITKIALNNLPTGRTTLSEPIKNNNCQSCWQPNEVRVTESYKTIQQTEILFELEIDSRNPTISELSNKSSKKPDNEGGKRPSESSGKSKKSDKRNRTQ